MILLCNFINSINLDKPYDYYIFDYCFKFYIAVSVSTAQNNIHKSDRQVTSELYRSSQSITSGSPE